MKKALSALLSFLIICSCFSSVLITSVSAATNEVPNYTTKVNSYSELLNRLETLKSKYVGIYWTTDGLAADSSGSTSRYYYGKQCNGFAKYIFNDLFCSGSIGSYDDNKYYYPTPNGATLIDKSWNFSSTDTVTVKNILSRSKVGDLIQVRRRGKTYGHTMIVGGVDSNGIWLFDCNNDGKCSVQYYHQDWSTFAAKNVGMSLYHSTNYPPEVAPLPESVSAFGYDYPVDWQQIADKEFVFQGWVETTKKVESITCSINDGQTYVKAGLYTRPDVPNATAFLTTIPTKHLKVGSNKIAVCVNYTDGTGVVAGYRTVNRTRPTMQYGYDYPTENQSVLNSTFLFQGWVVSDKDVKTITCSLNDGQKYIEAKLYKREDVPDATAFRKEINSNYLSYGENKVSVCVTYTDGTAETVATRKVNKKYAYALDYPANKMEVKDESFLFQGWFLTEKDIQKVQCIINKQTAIDTKLYTREDMPDAVAFRSTIYSHYLTMHENEIALSVTYSDGTSEVFDKRIIYNNILGDVNYDGQITIDDATTIQMHLIKMVTLDKAQLLKADVDNDVDVTVDDVTRVQMYIAKFIESF